jgi:E3 ubiquitin-protein ligase DOA10
MDAFKKQNIQCKCGKVFHDINYAVLKYIEVTIKYSCYMYNIARKRIRKYKGNKQ